MARPETGATLLGGRGQLRPLWEVGRWGGLPGVGRDGDVRTASGEDGWGGTRVVSAKEERRTFREGAHGERTLRGHWGTRVSLLFIWHRKDRQVAGGRIGPSRPGRGHTGVVTPTPRRHGSCVCSLPTCLRLPRRGWGWVRRWAVHRWAVGSTTTVPPDSPQSRPRSPRPDPRTLHFSLGAPGVLDRNWGHSSNSDPRRTRDERTTGDETG